MSSQPSATIPSLGETLGALYVGATVAAMQVIFSVVMYIPSHSILQFIRDNESTGTHLLQEIFQ